jgi:hypothetical protein
MLKNLFSSPTTSQTTTYDANLLQLALVESLKKESINLEILEKTKLAPKIPQNKPTMEAVMKKKLGCCNLVRYKLY